MLLSINQVLYKSLSMLLRCCQYCQILFKFYISSCSVDILVEIEINVHNCSNLRLFSVFFCFPENFAKFAGEVCYELLLNNCTSCWSGVVTGTAPPAAAGCRV